MEVGGPRHLTSMDYVRVVSKAIRSPRYSARTISIGRPSVSSERRLSRNIGIAEVDSSRAVFARRRERRLDALDGRRTPHPRRGLP